MDFKSNISRRDFLVQANCAAVGTASLLSSLLSLRLTAGAVSGSNFSDYRVLICLFLNGGNDSFNMLMPKETSAYNEYKNVRGGIYNAQTNPSGLAHAQNTLLPISSSGQSITEFGLHPELPYLKQLYDSEDLAFVSNVGSLIEPMNLSEYNSGAKSIPQGLFSHPDHQVHWQTLVPEVRGSSPKGWGGRMAEVMANLGANTVSNIGMNISLSGTNVLQTGLSTVPYITNPKGIVELKNYSQDPTLNLAVDNLLSNHYNNVYASTLAKANRNSIDAAVAFKDALDNLASPFDPTVLKNTLGADYSQTSSRLAMIPKIMQARTALNMDRQIFFVERGGCDHHQEVMNAQAALFIEINKAIEIFWEEIKSLGLEDNVVLYTASDFGRTLTSNGNGTDHAWGGNHFVIGGKVNGGQIFGEFPVLATGSNYDIGRGRLLPTTSVDAYMAELAGWFGVPQSEMTTVIPNINNFNFANLSSPLGLLNA